MSNETPWWKSLNVKIGGAVLALAALSVALIIANVFALGELKGDTAKLNLLGLGRMYSAEILYNIERIFDDDPSIRSESRGKVEQNIRNLDYRYQALLEGDASRNLPRVIDPEIQARITRSLEIWSQSVKPKLQAALAAPSRDANAQNLVAIHRELDQTVARTQADVAEDEKGLRAKADRVQALQHVFLVVVLVISGAVFVIVWLTTRRIIAQARTAQIIAHGDMSATAPERGSDEVAMLGRSFNAMTAQLRAYLESERRDREQLEEMLDAIRETTNKLSSAAAEILSGSSQQAAGAEEQAAAVNETVTTVEEIQRTAQQAEERAKGVAESAKRAAEIGDAGRQAVSKSIEAMEAARQRTESIAETIVVLAEQAQSIGEITATVTDIAEQTNLLALNAGIEAARAGEHGAGFNVVAREIKNLAEQAKKATAQVRQILSDIQQATNNAVMATDEGTKSAAQTLDTIREAGETINRLAETVNEAARAAAQIGASSSQQATGMSQIQAAMKDVSQTTTQSLASTRQAERAARDLNELGGQLQSLLLRQEAAT